LTAILIAKAFNISIDDLVFENLDSKITASELRVARKNSTLPNILSSDEKFELISVFGKNLEFIKKTGKFNTTEISCLAGISETTIQAIICKKLNFQLSTAMLISKALGIPIDVMIFKDLSEENITEIPENLDE
jgi:DNA-binding XRE family transcriptional regulator